MEVLAAPRTIQDRPCDMMKRSSTLSFYTIEMLICSNRVEPSFISPRFTDWNDATRLSHHQNSDVRKEALLKLSVKPKDQIDKFLAHEKERTN